jgi:hypothetical protein
MPCNVKTIPRFEREMKRLAKKGERSTISDGEIRDIICSEIED